MTNVGKPWTTVEEKRLHDMCCAGIPSSAIAETLGRSKTAVNLKCRKIGVARRDFWSDAEVEVLREMYPDQAVAIETLCQMFERTSSAVIKKAHSLGLKHRVTTLEKLREKEEAA